MFLRLKACSKFSIRRWSFLISSFAILSCVSNSLPSLLLACTIEFISTNRTSWLAVFASILSSLCNTRFISVCDQRCMEFKGGLSGTTSSITNRSMLFSRLLMRVPWLCIIVDKLECSVITVSTLCSNFWIVLSMFWKNRDFPSKAFTWSSLE